MGGTSVSLCVVRGSYRAAHVYLSWNTTQTTSGLTVGVDGQGRKGVQPVLGYVYLDWV